jgi:hypothetical protein
MPDAARVHGHGSPPLLKRQAKGFNLWLRHTAASRTHSHAEERTPVRAPAVF